MFPVFQDQEFKQGHSFQSKEAINILMSILKRQHLIFYTYMMVI